MKGVHIMSIFNRSNVNAFFVFLIMMVVSLCWSSQTQAAQEGDYIFTVIDGNAQITGYSGDGGAVTIPSTLGGARVTSIGDQAFISWVFITSISIPQGVTSIGDQAFMSCWRLTNVNLPQSLTHIGEFAFCGCTALTSINLPQSLTSISDSAFSECTSLTSIDLPQGLTSIDDLAFSGCKGLTSINLPQSLTRIGGAAFSNCTGLTSINIPSGVTCVETLAFEGCNNLANITFNSAKTTILEEANNYGYVTIPTAIKIRGYDPSTAKEYAATHGNEFEAIGTFPAAQPVTPTVTPKIILDGTTLSFDVPPHN
jgi:hypothetical protein